MRKLFILTALCAGSALANDDKVWQGDVEFGYVSTTGNSDTSTIKGRTDIKRELDPWRYQIHGDVLNAKENDERSAEKYFLNNKLDYKFSPRSYVFGYAGYEHDSFSGFDWQVTLASGLGYRLLENDTMTWDAEAGPGYRISKVDDSNSDDSDQREAILRGYTKYTWKLSDTATFEQELSVESGEDNTVTRSVTSLKTAIVAQLAMKLSYTVKNSSNVPDDTRHTDTETAVTIVYNF
jgi:putative salt-induced outer membrane protein